MGEPGRESGQPAMARAVAAAVRSRRERAGLSQAELARMAGVSVGTLSGLEAGSGNPTVGVLWALARQLGCAPADLLDDAPDPLVIHVPAAAGTRIRSDGLDARLVHRFAPNGPVELYEVELAPGKHHTSAPHDDGVYEHLWIAAGTVAAGPIEEPVDLAASDYACFQGWQPHQYVAGDEGARILLALSYTRSLWATRQLLGHGTER
jgi:transcriptional regulator with XRE-family HTH domain